MKWTFENFQVELNELKPEVREKAIEIAINLIEQKGLSEEEAIRQGIKRAGEWFLNLGG